MDRNNYKFISISAVLSFILNFGFLYLNFKESKDQGQVESDNQILIVKIRDIGRKDAKDKFDTVRLKDLTAQSTTDLLTRRSLSQPKRKEAQPLTRKKALDNIRSKKQVVFSETQENSDFVLNTSTHFESKRGTSIDELNTDELVYYAFKTRTAKQYKNAVLNNINNLKSKHPTLFLKLKNSIHQMRGKISYDKDGNVVAIKILKWSQSNEIQDFFVNALKDIRAIPNPPKGILNDNGFKATYDLQLAL